MNTVFICTVIVLLAFQITGQEQEELKARPGQLILERPTLICLGFEWRLSGDDNKNAAVTIEYRRKGNDVWKPHVGLWRTGGGRANYGYSLLPKEFKPDLIPLPDAFAGSLLNLQPDTEYEVRLTMSDPDGVDGEAVKVVTQKTRPEPAPSDGGEVRHVYPPGFKGEKKEPAYRSIMHAVNGHHPWCDCYQTVHPYKAKPGTVIKLHAGEYKAKRGSYRDSSGLWQHGTHLLVADGEPGNPIAIVAAGDGPVIIDGDSCDNLFNVMGADHLYFEGLIIRNTRIAFHGGFQGVIGCKGLTVKNCRFENIDYGILAQDGRSEDFYIADNSFYGGPIGPNEYGAYAVNLSGQGHVVCYNYTESFWDHINIFTNALADPALGQQARAIDFYNNDSRYAYDNFIETDGGLMNLRVLRNRVFHSPYSSWADPLSTQPVYQGPVYFIRNIVYNGSGGKVTFKYPGRAIIAYHNSSTHGQGHRGTSDMRNNIFMPPTMPSKSEKKGKRYTLIGNEARHGELIDYNAYLRGQFGYPPYATRINRRETKEFHTLAELAATIGQEKHSIELKDYSVFKNVPVPWYYMGYSAAKDKSKLHWAENDKTDFTPAEGSPLIDAGVVIPGINEDFAGSAPDIGAIEVGKPSIHFGPRDAKDR